MDGNDGDFRTPAIPLQPVIDGGIVNFSAERHPKRHILGEILDEHELETLKYVKKALLDKIFV